MSPSSILEKFISLNPKTFLISKKAPVNPEVAIYFEGASNNLYQIQQWVTPFTKLQQRHSILILARHKPIYDWVNSNTDIPCIYLRTIDDLQTFYDTNTEIKCILYVNHSFKNFQSLINNNVLHVHINHGESDKTSTTTNQVKAYDRVFLVADAALQKYTRNLIEYDVNKFIMVGRPQLDGVVKIEKPDTERKIILYAPTWEGTHHSMNFSSIERFGKQIVDTVINTDAEAEALAEIKEKKAILAQIKNDVKAAAKAKIKADTEIHEQQNNESTVNEPLNTDSSDHFSPSETTATLNTDSSDHLSPSETTEPIDIEQMEEDHLAEATEIMQGLEDKGYYLIYRPHPRTGTRDPKFKTLNNKLKAMVKASKYAHLDADSDSLSLCEIADYAIFDNSAVTVDYLKYDKPFILSDLFENQTGTRSDKPIITKAAPCINDDTINSLGEIIREELKNDNYKELRNEVRKQFIGNYTEGESTAKFIEEVTKVINTRDDLVRQRSKNAEDYNIS